MKLYIASDHAGLKEKAELAKYLRKEGHDLIDLGTNSEESVDYPEYSKKLVLEVLKTQGRGILICGSGVGVSIVANKFKGIIAALCREVKDAKLSREHNNSNVICLGSRFTPVEEMQKILDTWIETEFAGGRHQNRIDMFKNLGSLI